MYIIKILALVFLLLPSAPVLFADDKDGSPDLASEAIINHWNAANPDAQATDDFKAAIRGFGRNLKLLVETCALVNADAVSTGAADVGVALKRFGQIGEYAALTNNHLKLYKQQLFAAYGRTKMPKKIIDASMDSVEKGFALTASYAQAATSASESGIKLTAAYYNGMATDQIQQDFIDKWNAMCVALNLMQTRKASLNK